MKPGQTEAQGGAFMPEGSEYDKHEKNDIDIWHDT
jgi:hypothetical protein